MSVTIKSRPWGSQTVKVNQVYNGLNFVVDSDMKERGNFKYTADVYVNNTLVSKLKHNPDVSNSYYGIFNVGPIIENYLTYDLKWNDTTISNSTNSIVQYKVVFGEEASRNINIKKIESLGSNFYKVVFKGIHKLKENDWTFIRGGLVNGWYNTFQVFDNTSIKIHSLTNIALTETGAQGHYLNEGTFFINAQNTTFNSVSYFSFLIPTWNNVQVGDKIVINQISNLDNTPSGGYTAYEKNEWTITQITTVQYFGTQYYKIVTNCRSQGNISFGINGKVMFTSPYKITSATSDPAMAFNGVLQEDTYLTWVTDHTSYLPNSTSSKFLTNSKRTLNLYRDENHTLSMFGPAFNKSIFPLYATSIKFKFYSLIPLPFTFTSSNSGGLTKYTLNDTGDYSGTLIFQVGNEVFNSDVYGSITSSNYVSPHQEIVTTIPWSGTSETVSLNVYVVNYRTQNINTSTAWRVDIPCGPKNIQTYLNSTSWYSTYSLTKYEIYGAVSTQKTEKFTIVLNDYCGKYDRYRLMWLNENGAFDFFTFDSRSDIQNKIQRDTYNRARGKVQAGTNQFTYTQGERGRTTYNTNGTKSVKVTSMYLDQEDMNNLEWLYISPEVYYIDSDNNKIYPVTVTDTDVVVADKRNYADKGTLYNYTINFEYSNNLIVQRGGRGNTLSPVNATPITATPWRTPTPNISPWTFNGGGGLTLPQYGWSRDQQTGWY